MAEEPDSVTIPNLVQGVSQQAAPQRRDTQCEAQFDCINSPVDGCDSRPGARILRILSGKDWRDRHFYDIRRSKDEHYLVVSGGGEIDVRDLLDGTACTVTPRDGTTAAYLTTSEAPKDTLLAATIDDHTFIANREKLPAMAAALSPVRQKEAIFYFRAGAYSSTYVIAIILGGIRYTWSYKTPDNSVSGNAEYITTGQLAATFYRGLTGYAAPVASSGSAGSGAGATHEGSTSGVSAPYTATVLNFFVEINGNVLRVFRTDGLEFSVDSADGNGDAHLKALKGTVPVFSDLPAKCFDGVVLKVKGESKTEKDDYYVRYRAAGTGGYWEETIAPGIAYQLDRATMPYSLVNTDYREFTFGQVEWGNRVAGDLDTAKTPSFVGKPIYDLAYDNSRLAVVLEGGVVWSKSRDPYVFFTDTAQTALADAPVDYTVSGTREVALIRRMVHKAGLTYLWAEQAQFSVTANDKGFAEGNVEIKPSTSYEFAERCPPCAVAQSLYFATETDAEGEESAFTTIRDLYVVGDTRTPPQDTDVTAHVPQYIPAGLRWLSATDTLNMMVGISDEAPNKLFLYNWLISDNSRVQSAWNTWRLPSGCEILWGTIYRGTLKLIVQRGPDVHLLAVRLAPRQRDPGVTGAKYATRLDLMVSEASTTRVFNSGTGRTTVTLPYAASEGTPENFVVVGRDGPLRGYIFKTVSVAGTSVVVEGDCSASPIYLGFRVDSRRAESEFYLRSEKGSEPVDRLQVHAYHFVHADTAYYRAEVKYSNGRESVVPFEGRFLGDPANEFNTVPISTGQLKVPVMSENTQFRLELVNDSPFPSRWTSAKVTYKATYRSNPRRTA